jgi:hypothetical protein
MNILLPSTATDALYALGRVATASDVKEYLHEAEVRTLDGACQILVQLRATAEQVCYDPRHDARLAIDAWIRKGVRRANARRPSDDTPEEA